MSSTTPAIRDLARRLVDLEARDVGRSAAGGGAARVCEKLRHVLTKLAGSAGYHALITRAIATATVEAPVLDKINVRPDGSIDLVVSEQSIDASVSVVVHLLSLLVTFVGEPLTLSLVGNAWPELASRRSIAEGEL